MTRTLGSLAHALADLFQDGTQTQEYPLHHRHPHDDSEFLLLGQNRSQLRSQTRAQPPVQTHEAHATDANPTRQEVLNYLGELAKDYHLPPKLVYAVADAESNVNPKIPPGPITK